MLETAVASCGEGGSYLRTISSRLFLPGTRQIVSEAEVPYGTVYRELVERVSTCDVHS